MAQSQDNAAIVERVYAAMNSGDPEDIDAVVTEVLVPDWENVPLPPGRAGGAEGFRRFVPWLRSVFPDYTITHEEVVVDGDRVAVRSTARGTQNGDFYGVPGTGRAVEFRAFDFHHLENGRIVRSWHLEDHLGAMLQVGATITNPEGSTS